MERKYHCFIVGRRMTRLSNYFKSCSLITSSNNCPMLLSCSWHDFFWALVIPGISGRTLFSWMCASLWFLCSFLFHNMSLLASHLKMCQYFWYTNDVFLVFKHWCEFTSSFLFSFLWDLRQGTGVFYPFFFFFISSSLRYSYNMINFTDEKKNEMATHLA